MHGAVSAVVSRYLSSDGCLVGLSCTYVCAHVIYMH